MTQEEVGAAFDVMAGTLYMNNLKIHILFDLSATHLFITSKIVANLGKEAKRVEKRFYNRDTFR
jgi:hypothetical protein